jgi:hypothetical protein
MVTKAKVNARKYSKPGSLVGRSNIVDAAQKGELVAIIGTGSSLALTDGRIPSLAWRGLVESGFEFGRTKGKISDAQVLSWTAQLASQDLDELLSAAEFMSRKLEAPKGDLYARWLDREFRDRRVSNVAMSAAIQAIAEVQIPICTLNYDTLLEEVTGLPSVTLDNTTDVLGWMRNESKSILHLHGIWTKPSSCVLGIRDYADTLDSDVRDLIQRSLAAFKRLLFIGCGDTFADPNFSALIQWLRRNLRGGVPEHYALVREDEVKARNADLSWHGFVDPLSYGSDRSDLAPFLRGIAKDAMPPAVPSSIGEPKTSPGRSIHPRLLRDYATFLVRDCGQMTIEGVRADMDTAQRKFDLERLFVPLKLAACPPEFPPNDPDREQKLAKWLEKNSEAKPFGEVFATKSGLALLALPGGGKTILLKRLAVAYADPARRSSSADGLPDLSLMPVLIRCREWREHIRLPIPTLLKNIPAITGQAQLNGLDEALAPLLKQGSVLLLVDGLDEIHDDGDRSTFVEHLEAFMDEYRSIRLVVTSREAGFGLVAPSLKRFCQAWRVAPLQEDAITLLCSHWHRLMTGDSPESVAEAKTLSLVLVRNPSLRRLAENPLLLTMLLVVKHGAGRLPPDKVSLYGRAVEVLLDTWNIKGHAPLAIKEAEPQLAYVAFKLMLAGKQTATEAELLSLFEEAREKVPQIRRYAKDTPHDFLKRVELRSSLLLEAGHQSEGGRLVPFYQFRHLTFQEYLAAIAAAQGHYEGYKKDDSVLTPLASVLNNDEWKEVIPMAAVLAKKQAEPLMVALVNSANSIRNCAQSHLPFDSREQWLTHPNTPPAPVSRLLQCLVEEAEASPETLTAALRAVAFFGRGLRSQDDWKALARGPYAEEFLHQAWLLYSDPTVIEDAWIRNTLAAFAAFRHLHLYPEDSVSGSKIAGLLNSASPEEVCRALLACCGLKWIGSDAFDKVVPQLLPAIERHMFSDERTIWIAAVWAWALFRRSPTQSPSNEIPVLDRLLALWFSKEGIDASPISFAFSTIRNLTRDAWTPKLTPSQIEFVKHAATSKSTAFNKYGYIAAAFVAFYSRSVWPDKELHKVLKSAVERLPQGVPGPKPALHDALQQIGAEVQKHSRSSGSRGGAAKRKR